MADSLLSQLRRDVREWLGVTAILGKMDYIRDRLGDIVTEASQLTAAIDALVGENTEVKQVLSDLVAKVQSSGNPELIAAAGDAVNRVNSVVADLHTAAVAASVTSAPTPTPIPAPVV